MTTKAKIGVLSLLSIILIGVFIAISAITIIETGNVGVKYKLGQIDRNEVQPGLHFITPIISKIEPVFTKTVMVNYTDAKSQKKDVPALYTERTLQGEDTTGLEMGVDMIVEVKPQADKMADMYIEVGKLGFQKKVLQPIRGEVRKVLGQYHAEEIMSKRKLLERDIASQLESLFAKNPYYKLLNIQLKKIYLPPKVKEAIKEVQLQKQYAKIEREKIAQKQAEAQSLIAIAKRKAIAIAKEEEQTIETKDKAEAIRIITTVMIFGFFYLLTSLVLQYK